MASIDGCDAAGRSTRALGCQGKCHTSATAAMLKSAELGLPLRFRGSGTAGSNSMRRGALAVGPGVAGRRSSQETGCVNPQRSGEHKVPRRRASAAGPLRGGVLALVSASSVNRGIRICRCGDGKSPREPGLRRPPSFEAGDEAAVSGKGLRWLREAWAYGNLTTRSSDGAASSSIEGRGMWQFRIKCLRSAAAMPRFAQRER